MNNKIRTAIETAEKAIESATHKDGLVSALEGCAHVIESANDEEIDALDEFAVSLILVAQNLEDDVFDDGDATVDRETGMKDFDYDLSEPSNLEDNRSAADEALQKFSL